jgi:hypothetical protein
MAVDTAAKRYSMMGVALITTALVNVNGTVESDDQSTWLQLYGGIALGEPPEVVPGGGNEWAAIASQVRRRRKENG